MIRNPTILIPLVILLAITSGCSRFSSKTGNDEVVFAATEVGAPEGPAATKNIGPSGGTLASPDGRLTLTVPPNALTETLQFSIQPITNKAEGGLGMAYRLEPSGRTFTTPLEMTIRYEDSDLEGSSAEALAMAYQDEQQAWHLANVTRTDQSAKTFTVSTTHFTDWSFLEQVRISPQRATLHVGESMILELTGCLRSDQLVWLVRVTEPTKSVCHVTDGQYKWGLHADWYADAGTIDDHSLVKIVYTAPAKKPIPNVVTVSYPYWASEHRGMFTAHIKIVDRGYRASGHDGPTSYAGIICSLDEPFTITGNNSLVPYPIKFFPTSGTAGTLSYLATWKALVMSGSGTYTVEEADTDSPLILAQTQSTLTAMGRSRSGGGPAHIDLTPLDTDECSGR